MTAPLYVTVLRDDHTDDVVQVWTDLAAARAAVEEWAESKIDDGDPLDYIEYPDEPLILIAEIGDGTAYEGRYVAYIHAVAVQS